MIIERKNIFVSCMVILSAFILVNKLLLPTTIQIMIQNGSTTLKEIPNVYTIIDMIVISVSSFLLGISIFYLLTVKPETDTRPDVTKNMTLSESSMGSLIISNTGSITEKQSETDSDVTKIENVLNIFKGNEQRIIKELYHNSELTQAELAARADIPKSTLSRILGDLEKRGLIIRYENGMSKMVKLADSFQK